MDRLCIRATSPAAEVCSEITAWEHPATPLRPPVRSYPGQNTAPLYAICPTYTDAVPPYRLCIGQVEDATVLVHPGYDGVVLTADKTAVRETTFYSSMSWYCQETAELDIEHSSIQIDDAFIAFDNSWPIYYHWLIFCLGKAGVGGRFTPPHCKILVPDPVICRQDRPVGVATHTFDQIERVVEPARLLKLPNGAHRIRRAHILFVQDGQPSDISLHPMFADVFRSLKPSPQKHSRGERIMVLRGGRGGELRVTPQDEAVLEPVAVEYGFRRERLETLAFEEQVELFSRAEIVIAPHGSGLANLVFARDSPPTKLVELQTEMDGPGLLRPWFFLMAGAAGLPYAFLNRQAGDFTPNRLRQSLSALGVRRPWFGLRFARTLHWVTSRCWRRLTASVKRRVGRPT